MQTNKTILYYIYFQLVTPVLRWKYLQQFIAKYF